MDPLTRILSCMHRPGLRGPLPHPLPNLSQGVRACLLGGGAIVKHNVYSSGSNCQGGYLYRGKAGRVGSIILPLPSCILAVARWLPTSLHPRCCSIDTDPLPPLVRAVRDTLPPRVGV